MLVLFFVFEFAPSSLSSLLLVSVDLSNQKIMSHQMEFSSIAENCLE
jgi:hypothetical protein